MKINYLSESKNIKESVESEVLWKNRNRSIIKDGYGFGISNGVNVNRFYINNDGKAVYDYEPPMTIKTTVDRLIRQGKFNNPNYSENPKYVGNASKYGRGVEESFEKDGGPYWYFTKHGLGPGMLPKGVNVVDTIEDDNYGTYVALDKVLTTQELKEYELKEKKPPMKEGWSHFEFTSGANPYIAKTKDEVDSIKRNRGNSVKYVGNINGIDYYKVDDSEEKDLFSVNESTDSTIPQAKQLKQALQTFDRNGRFSRRGDWSIANGGYDEEWEIYYKEIPVVHSVAHKISLENNTFDETLIDFIKSVYTDYLDESLKEDVVNKEELVDELDNLPYVSIAVDEGDYIKIKGKWRTSSRKTHSDYLNIRTFLNKKLGDNNFELVYESNISRDKGKEISCSLRLELKNNNLKESSKSWGGHKHPEQDKIEQALMSIPCTSKLEFDYRPNDGVYSVPENHLVILVFCDYELFGDGFDYFKNRKKWKQSVLSKLSGLGWKQEDPVEDNDTYLYLVMRKSKSTNESKSLSESSTPSESDEEIVRDTVQDMCSENVLFDFCNNYEEFADFFKDSKVEPTKELYKIFLDEKQKCANEIKKVNPGYFNESESIKDSGFKYFKVKCHGDIGDAESGPIDSSDDVIIKVKSEDEIKKAVSKLGYLGYSRVKEIGETESLSESNLPSRADCDTVFDFLTDHFEFNSLEDKSKCVSMILDNHEGESVVNVSEEELNKVVSQCGGRPKNETLAENSWRPYDNEKGQVMADRWYASRYPDDEVGIEQLRGITLDDALKDRSILGHCDTQVRERVYAQLDKYIPLSKDSPMYKKVNEAVISSSTEFDDDTDDLSYYYDDELFNDNLENSPYTEIASKQVADSDGFMTDYTMYMNINTGEYVFVFGDKDIYRPEDGYFDWECETEEEAKEWFDNYNGFDNEDDLWEGYVFNLNEETETESPIICKKNDGSYLVTTDDNKGYVAYNKDDECIGNITANSESEAETKFNANKYDE